MRVLEIRERRVSVESTMHNAYIDFGAMAVSLVALVTDVVRDGRTVVGFGFSSHGRYAPSGLLRERFIPGFSMRRRAAFWTTNRRTSILNGFGKL